MIERSKPVLYSIACNGAVEEIGGDSQGFSREEVQAELDSWGDVVHGVYSVCALYSQEYVYALLAELEAKDERIAELEYIRADASQVFKEIGNELGCNPDNESIMMAIDALKEREKRVVALAGGNADLWETMAARLEAAEAKLATPVRLPPIQHREFLGLKIDSMDAEQVRISIRANGFKVEGDE